MPRNRPLSSPEPSLVIPTDSGWQSILLSQRNWNRLSSAKAMKSLFVNFRLCTMRANLLLKS